MHFTYAPGAYLLYAPGALYIQICSWSIFDLELPQIIHALRAAAPGAAAPGA